MKEIESRLVGSNASIGSALLSYSHSRLPMTCSEHGMCGKVKDIQIFKEPVEKDKSIKSKIK